MRSPARFVLLLALAAGCSKPPAADPADPAAGPAPPAAAGSGPAGDRARWLTAIKSTNPKTRGEAIDELATRAENDPETVAALLDLLRDPTTAGPGRTHPKMISSTREAAARALLQAGPTGEAALRDRGLAILKEGLTNPSAAVREHTAYTLGLLGPLARSLSADVQKLCTDAEASVRGAAFDALRRIGVTDVAGFVRLLTHDNSEVARLAAEALPRLTELPDTALEPLAAALKSTDGTVRLAAAAALARAGTRAASAVPALVAAVEASYPAEPLPEQLMLYPSDLAYWDALAAAGEPAVGPTAGLLKHAHPLVRLLAARTLGQIGPPARPATADLKAVLADRYGAVALEAAAALCRLGTDTDAAQALIRQALDAPGEVAQTAVEVIARLGEAGRPLLPAALAKLEGPDPFARYAAVGLVGTLPVEEAARHAAVLGRLAADTGEGAPTPELAAEAGRHIRLEVGRVLKRLGPAAAPAAEPLAQAFIRETDEAVRDQFLDAFVAMGPGAKPALAVLLKLATTEQTPADRRAVVLPAMAEADPGSADVARAVLAASRDAAAVVRSAAAAAAARLDPLPRELAERLVELAATDRATTVRVAALQALAAAGPRARSVRAALEPLAAGKYPEFALLAQVARAAIDGDVRAAAPAVRAALTHSHAATRASAAEALLLVGPTAEDVPVLLRLLRERSAAILTAAAKAVARLGPAARDARLLLLRLEDHPDADVRAAVAQALARLDAKE